MPSAFQDCPSTATRNLEDALATTRQFLLSKRRVDCTAVERNPCKPTSCCRGVLVHAQPNLDLARVARLARLPIRQILRVVGIFICIIDRFAARSCVPTNASVRGKEGRLNFFAIVV